MNVSVCLAFLWWTFLEEKLLDQVTWASYAWNFYKQSYFKLLLDT